MSSRRVASGVLLLALVAVGIALHQPVQAGMDRAERSRLQVVDVKSLAGFKTEFNRAAESLRVVLLLSPT